MTVRPILRWPDPVLSRVCAPVGDRDVTGLVGDLFETMYAAPGRGLAAPQVGEVLRVFVMDATWKDGDMSPVACIDPEILWMSDDTVPMDEGCLSIPGVAATIQRPARIRLRWRGLDGAVHEADLDGAEARVALHEYDHLDGKVTFDRLEPEARAALEADYAAVPS
ncbi:peptide deformylase [Roseivivax marinus]|jgi:peptide deformylase|uniref:Peptide deformylase n=1 Tax=Roseivivax marinus TaxID=1379903 RepID=W4HHC3_9RHOB|nr:peptide deformylase [Roseivivax marinus]ETW12152.1 peptide deformylase [Roseivivax marinus]